MKMEEKNHTHDPSRTRIADLSDDDKPREKALRFGIRTLSDTELIALLLGGGMPGKSVLELSREVYRACGNSLSAMAQISIRDMCNRFKGIGPAKAVTIAAALELGGRRKDIKADSKPQIRCPEDAYEVIRQDLQNLRTEEFWVLLLSRAHRVIEKKCISSGGTGATVVETKMVLKMAIDHLASAIILVHNHPSGNLNPSVQDDNLTRKLKEAGQIVEIPVIDHLIVGPDGFYSYGDAGRI